MLRKAIKRALLKQHTVRTARYQSLNRIQLKRSRVLANVALIQRQHPEFTVMPVLKGNAYGHGLTQMARILNETDCPMLAVDGYFEAAEIRDISRARILVMGYILPRNVHLLDTKRCSFVVQDIAGLQAFGALKRPVKIHLELNTGFNRLGLQPDELLAYMAELKRHPNLELEGVMSHLADADNEQDDGYTKTQVARFDAFVAQILEAGFRPKFIHLAQTAGSAKATSKYANAIRLGIGLYGINPLGSGDLKYRQLAGLQPVLELKSTIIKVLELQKGDKVSYNGTFTAPDSMRIGVLPLGYYEGLPRVLSNKGCVTYQDNVLPIVGRICMDHIMIDLGHCNLQVGDEVTVISNDSERPNSLAGLQAKHGLFAYETAVRLASSLRREIM